VKPPTPINPLITGITGISNNTVATAPAFQEVGKEFIKFLKDNCKVRSSGVEKDDDLSVNVEDLLANSSWDDDDDDDEGRDDILVLIDIVVVAHNGIRFDIPFLFKSFESYAVDIRGIPFKGKIYTIDLVKCCAVRGDQNLVAPVNYQLGTLYQYVTGSQLNDGHRARSDAKATMEIFQSKRFWERRRDVCKPLPTNVVLSPRNHTPTSSSETKEDSDRDGESDFEEDEDGDDGDVEDYGDVNGMIRKTNTPFTAPNVRERYDDVFTNTYNNTANNNEDTKKQSKFVLNYADHIKDHIELFMWIGFTRLLTL